MAASYSPFRILHTILSWLSLKYDAFNYHSQTLGNALLERSSFNCERLFATAEQFDKNIGVT